MSAHYHVYCDVYNGFVQSGYEALDTLQGTCLRVAAMARGRDPEGQALQPNLVKPSAEVSSKTFLRHLLSYFKAKVNDGSAFGPCKRIATKLGVEFTVG